MKQKLTVNWEPRIPLGVAKKYFDKLDEIEAKFQGEILELECKMAKETGIEDIEFFWCDNSIVGIGSVDRKMKLIHREY